MILFTHEQKMKCEIILTGATLHNNNNFESNIIMSLIACNSLSYKSMILHDDKTILARSSTVKCKSNIDINEYNLP